MEAAVLRERFADAERRFARRLGVEVDTRFVDVPLVPQPVRVLECGAGPAVLLVHGGPAFAGAWLPLMAKLAGFRLVAVERPGYGLTGYFDYGAVDYRRFAVSFLEQVLAALGLEQVPVAGSSMGGLWSLWLALERPERVSSVVQLGCPPFVLQPRLPVPFRLLATPGLNRFMLSFERPSPRQVRTVFARMGHAAAAMDGWLPEFWDAGVAFEQLPDYQRGWLAELEQTRGLKGPPPDMVLREEALARVRQPTLFLWGSRDNFGSPEVGRRVVRAMPNATLEVVDGGHLPWLDAPGLCAARMAAFLERAPAPAAAAAGHAILEEVRP